jgi:hypothetical protein
MAKKLRRQQAKLATRRQAFSGMKGDTKGYKFPGSMNRRKQA